MTSFHEAKDKVKAKYPNAHAVAKGFTYFIESFSANRENRRIFEILGCGNGETAAWLDAASKLEET